MPLLSTSYCFSVLIFQSNGHIFRFGEVEMAERGNGKAVGYIRGRLWKGKWTPDARLQRQRIQKFANAYEYEIIKFDGEQQKFSLATRRGFDKFLKLVSVCHEHKATFLYVDIGNWRPNVVLNEYVSHYKTRPIKQGWKFLAVPPDRKTMEAIERQARMEKFESKRRPRKKVAKERRKILSPVEQWQAEHKISRRRLKGFEHLYSGVDPIYRFIERLFEETPNLSNKRIAWALDREAYLTVDGNRWTDETVRKVRSFVKRDDFCDFIHLKEKDKDLIFDTEE